MVTGLNGERLTFRRATIRTFAKSVVWAPTLILRAITDVSRLPKIGDAIELPTLALVAIAAASRRQQCVHDAIADTLVVAMVPAPAAATVPEPAPAVPPSAILPPRRRPFLSPPASADDLKECPACAELIRRNAKKCRYCGERLDDPAQPGPDDRA